MEELQDENKRLKEKIAELEAIINRGSSGSTGAYSIIRGMIIQKVENEVEIPEKLETWQKKDVRQRAERQIMRDLKWDLRVRNIADFRPEHIEKAKEYIERYILSEDLKKSRWA